VPENVLPPPDDSPRGHFCSLAPFSQGNARIMPFEVGPGVAGGGGGDRPGVGPRSRRPRWLDRGARGEHGEEGGGLPRGARWSRTRVASRRARLA